MLGGLNPWVIVLVAVFLIFIVCVFSAKKDSAVRAIAYTLILGILFVYILIEHLLPEIRCVCIHTANMCFVFYYACTIFHAILLHHLWSNNFHSL